MRGRVLRVRDVSPQEESAWRELAAHSLESNPLFGPDCVIPAATHLPHGERINLVVAEEGGRYFGAFPLLRQGRNDADVTPVAGLRRRVLTTNVRRFRFSGTPLLHRDRPDEAARTIFEHLRDTRNLTQAGVVFMDSLVHDGEAYAALQGALATCGVRTATYHQWHRPIVRRRSEEEIDHFNSQRTNRRFARQRRGLEGLLEAPLVLRDRSDDPGALEDFLTMESAGYKGREGIDLRSHPGEAEWLVEMCRRLRESGDLCVVSLNGGDQSVAMEVLIRAGDGWLELFTTYDEAFAKFSPGILLQRELFKFVFAHFDADWMDSCTYEGNTTMEFLYPDRLNLVATLVVTGGVMDWWSVRTTHLNLRLLKRLAAARESHPRLSRSLDRVVART